MKNFVKYLVLSATIALAACGEQVEVPPAHIGKIMTSKGYQEGTVPTSKFRLEWCWSYCDKLILLDTSDKNKAESLTIFMPQDKLNMDVTVQVTLGLNPKRTNELFTSIAPIKVNQYDSAVIPWDDIYKTYASQIVQTEVREYLSRYTISEVASSMEKINGDVRNALTKVIQERTPFTVRYVGITNVKYPKIITDAQENAAERRERIQQEEAQLEISKVTLQRELEEAKLKRQIELEKAQVEAAAQRIQREVVDETVLKLRQIELQQAWVEKWNGQLPTTVTGENTTFMMPVQGR